MRVQIGSWIAANRYRPWQRRHRWDRSCGCRLDHDSMDGIDHEGKYQIMIDPIYTHHNDRYSLHPYDWSALYMRSMIGTIVIDSIYTSESNRWCPSSLCSILKLHSPSNHDCGQSVLLLAWSLSVSIHDWLQIVATYAWIDHDGILWVDHDGEHGINHGGDGIDGIDCEW